MIAVRIPKEIRAYKEKLVAGLTFRQLISSIIAIAVCVPLYIYGRKIMPEELVSWMVIVVALPCAGIGFFKYNGMVFEKFIAAVFKYEFLYPSKRIFRTENCFREWQEAAEAEDKKSIGFIKKKNLQKLSVYRAHLLFEAEKRGTSADFTVLNNQALALNGGFNKNSKKDKKDKNNEADKTKSLSALDNYINKKADKIKIKQSGNAHYIPSHYERFILKRWARNKEKAQLAKIKREAKDISSTNSKMLKRRSLKTSIPRTTQQTLPYIADYEEGLFELELGKFSKMYRIKDINYSVAKEDEQVQIFCKYGEFFNYFSEDMNVAITIDNRVVSIQEKEETVFYKMKGDELDGHREEYNKIMKRQIVEGRNDIIQSKYITVVIDAETPIEALMRFHKIDTEVITNLKKQEQTARLYQQPSVCLYCMINSEKAGRANSPLILIL